MANPKIRLPGVRASIPAGFLLGRSSAGTGEIELIPAPGLQTLGSVQPGPTPAPVIADQSVLGNISGATAAATQVLISALLGVGSALKWATARTLSFTGDATGTNNVDGSANVATALTLATVNPDVGTFGDGTHVAQVTVNAKGLVTAAVDVAISGGGGGGSYLPLVTGAEPPILVSDGDGHLITVPYIP